jgi:hypothetical protein
MNVSTGVLDARRRRPRLDNRLQILVRDRLDNVPRFIKHSNLRSPMAGALFCITERVSASVLAAENRTHAFSLESNPATLFLPERISGRSDLDYSHSTSINKI